MEVFMSGVPVDFSPETLKKNLDPFVAKLGIPIQAYKCDKFRKKSWAKATFAHWELGERFLAAHSEQMVLPPGPEPLTQLPNGRRPSTVSSTNTATGPSHVAVPGFPRGPPSFLSHKQNLRHHAKPRKIARLFLTNHPIYCSKSKKPYDRHAVPGAPDPITLRGLQYTMLEIAHPTRVIEKEAAPLVFQLESLSCGLNIFEKDSLFFVPEVEFQVTGVAKFSKRALLIKLSNRQVIRISLERVHIAICSFDHTITLTLTEHPLFFSEEDSMSDASDPTSLFNRMDALNLNDKDIKRTRLTSLNEQHASVVGHCLVYRLKFLGNNLHQQMLALERHETLVFVRDTLLTQRSPTRGFTKDAMVALNKAMQDSLVAERLPFSILFQLHVLATDAYLHPTTVLGLLKMVESEHKFGQPGGRKPISAETLKLLLKNMNWPEPHGDPTEFELRPLVEFLHELDVTARTNSTTRRSLLSPSANTASIHKVTVTPTTMKLRGPELEAKNRILRKFPDHHEYFIRVLFSDEDGDDLRYGANINLDRVWQRFKRVFRDGITIAGRVFSFLAFSHSSLRSHSAWFCAPFVDNNGRIQNSDSIIKGLGSFGQIRCPARCAARIGQAFSETPYDLDLDYHQIPVYEIPDVESADGERVFSDGVGTLSKDVMHRIWEEIPLGKGAPSAFQIRMGGSKGMLALNPRLQGSVIYIRPSMKKFPSLDNKSLEICDMASKPIPLVLNRQMIKIMEDMGVNTQWFLDMQELKLKELQNVTENAYTVADFIKHSTVGDGIRLHRLFRHVANLGMDWRKDDFLIQVVSATVLRELRLLKHKARIPIWKGITLFGIMDETGYLQENEIFMAYDTMGGRFAPPPGEGQLLVTRSPALHPGDIQLAQRVVPPPGHPLHELSNVIVFSSKGARDLPSQLSGGDLDGDIYNIIWDEQAMPKRTFPAADYPRVPPLELDREVQKEDMAEFFVDFMKLDHLGVVATRHMIIADQKDGGTLERDCIELAGLHSTAVDFSKTGRPVNLNSLPKANQTRPDFLAPGPEARIVDKSTIELDQYIIEAASDEDEAYVSRQRFDYYPSEKILGQLYRAVDEQKVWRDVRGKVQRRGTSSLWDDLILVTQPWYEATVEDPQGYKDYHESAHNLRVMYEEAIGNAMNEHSSHPIQPLSELEVFIGSIVSKTGKPSNRQRDQSIKLRDEFDRVSIWINRAIRKPAEDADHPGPMEAEDQRKHAGLHLALACVHAGCEKTSDFSGAHYENMQSFKVVAACAYLSELHKWRRDLGSGGFVGVKGGGGASLGQTTARAGKSKKPSAPPSVQFSFQGTIDSEGASLGQTTPRAAQSVASSAPPSVQSFV